MSYASPLPRSQDESFGLNKMRFCIQMRCTRINTPGWCPDVYTLAYISHCSHVLGLLMSTGSGLSGWWNRAGVSLVPYSSYNVRSDMGWRPLVLWLRNTGPQYSKAVTVVFNVSEVVGPSAVSPNPQNTKVWWAAEGGWWPRNEYIHREALGIELKALWYEIQIILGNRASFCLSLFPYWEFYPSHYRWTII